MLSAGCQLPRDICEISGAFWWHCPQISVIFPSHPVSAVSAGPRIPSWYQLSLLTPPVSKFVVSSYSKMYYSPPTISCLADYMQMCDKKMIHWAQCGHQTSADFLRCAAARQRPGQAICVPPSGHSRDLPQVLDIQDRNTPGLCPECRRFTPPSSAGSQH